MVNKDDFGVCNFRLARKVMESGKCQCKPKEKCPCKEWIKDGLCACNVFWDLKTRDLSKTEIKIVELIIEKLDNKIEETLAAKQIKD